VVELVRGFASRPSFPVVVVSLRMLFMGPLLGVVELDEARMWLPAARNGLVQDLPQGNRRERIAARLFNSTMQEARGL
jgi:hypothetical protein